MAENKNVITVLEKKIPVKIEDLDIFKLRFWLENPRVNSTVKKQSATKEIKDSDIEQLLRQEEHVKILYQEIKKHGGLIDPIIVKGNIVLEGNSRLCAYRMLYEKAEQNNDEDEMLKWSYIKANIIPIDTSEEVIFVILGTWHIKGKKQWDTFEKAAYLKRMKEEHGYTTEKISEMINETKTFVETNIEAHDLMVDNDVHELEKYSYFIEMVKNKGINDEQKKDTQTIPKLIRAIKDGQFSRAEEIRDVPKVLKDKVAKRMFFQEMIDFSEALEVTKERNPEFDSAFYRLLKNTTKHLQGLTAKKAFDIIDEIQEDANKKDIIRRFDKEVKKFIKVIGLK